MHFLIFLKEGEVLVGHGWVICIYDIYVTSSKSRWIGLSLLACLVSEAAQVQLQQHPQWRLLSLEAMAMAVRMERQWQKKKSSEGDRKEIPKRQAPSLHWAFLNISAAFEASALLPQHPSSLYSFFKHLFRTFRKAFAASLLKVLKGKDTCNFQHNKSSFLGLPWDYCFLNALLSEAFRVGLWQKEMKAFI